MGGPWRQGLVFLDWLVWRHRLYMGLAEHGCPAQLALLLPQIRVVKQQPAEKVASLLSVLFR